MNDAVGKRVSVGTGNQRHRKRLLRKIIKFTAALDRDGDEVWVAESPAILGCASQGVTREKTLQSIREAIKLRLEVQAERGLPLTIETHQ